MDDDLMSLRGSSSPFGGSSMPDEEPLGLGLDDFVPAAPEPVSEPAPMSSVAAPAAKSKPAPKAKPAKPAKEARPKSAPKPKTKSASGGAFLGMTPQQSMLLSIFLFLDVAVLGCLILIALGAIKL
jgi:hypothetical protein